MTLAKLNQIVTDYEGRLADGGETPLLGRYNERMRQVTGQGGMCARDPDVTVPDNEAAWWQRAYALYEADQAKPRDEQTTDIQDIFDAV